MKHTQTSFARKSVTNDGALPPLAGVLSAGMLDWPGRVAATVFLAGCNLRCPYCHNPELVSGAKRTSSAAEFLQMVKDRRHWLDGVVITGGEPCTHEGLSPLLHELKQQNMPVKLDTNGTCPDALEELLAVRLVDYVALDIKATPARYERATGRADAWPLVERSVKWLIDSGVDHEFRTTCYPLAVGPDDPVTIASALRGGRRYVLQQFRPHKTLDPAALSVRPHASETLFRAAERCHSHIPTTVRGT